MNKFSLREKHVHGTAELPVGFYRMEGITSPTVLDVHWHDEAEFLWVEEGSATFMVDGSLYDLAEGDCVYIPPGELHGGFSLNDSTCTYQAAVFDLAWLASANDEITQRILTPLHKQELILQMPLSSHNRFGRRILARLRRLYRLGRHTQDAARAWRVKAELYLILAEFISDGHFTKCVSDGSSHSRSMERFKPVLVHIENHYMKKIKVYELAAIANMSEGHFCRAFKVQMRQTPVEYLNHYRIQRAASLLQHTTASIVEIAAEAGFEHLSYFIKKFRDRYGCTPAQYRKHAR
ncbi:AraC family transcriptional regulator [Paenibacillus thalictri]|nr:AraC family transcriptional regulator [Paenibacillus thalictri]